MRTSLVAFFALALASAVVGRPTPTPVPAPKPIEKEGLICRTKQQDAELRDWISGIQTQAQKAVGEAQEAKKSNFDLQQKLQLASQDGLQLSKERDQAIIDKDTVLHKLHLFKVITSILVVAAVVFGALQLPPPISFYVMGAGSLVGIGIVWAFL